MLQAINDRIKGWLGAFVIALITLPFALWGIQSYIGGAEAPYAARVGDIEISVQELDYNVARKKQELREKLGGQLPFEDSMIKRLVLDQVINRKILESYTREDGYRVSDVALTSNIKALFSQSGDFDRDIFESIVRQRGQTIPQFEEEIRNDIRVQQFTSGVRVTALVTNAELERLAKIEAQQRDISLLRFKVADQMDAVTVSDDEIKAAYHAHADQFMTEEQVSVDYIELTGDQLSGDINVDEQKVRQAYDAYVAQVSQNEQRKASHILIKPEPDRKAALGKIESIKKSLTEGKSFADLARQYSADAGSANNGGDLDWIEHGQMVKPFEDALFAMSKTGDVSDVVETQFGLHLVKLDGVRKEKPISLAEKRKEIEAELKRDAISSLIYDKSEALASTAYENPDSLDPAAEEVNLPVKKSERMTRTGGKGIAADPKVRTAAFSDAVLSQGLNSDVIELGPDHLVVLRIRDHIPAKQLPLEQVKDQLVKNLRMQKAREITMTLAEQARDKIMAGTDADSLVTKNVSLDKPQMLKRTDGDKIAPAALKLAFDMPKPETGKPEAEVTTLNGAEIAVLILHRVTTPDKVEQSQLDAIKGQRLGDIAATEFNAALAEISADYKIQKNPKVLE